MLIIHCLYCGIWFRWIRHNCFVFSLMWNMQRGCRFFFLPPSIFSNHPLRQCTGLTSSANQRLNLYVACEAKPRANRFTGSIVAAAGKSYYIKIPRGLYQHLHQLSEKLGRHVPPTPSGNYAHEKTHLLEASKGFLTSLSANYCSWMHSSDFSLGKGHQNVNAYTRVRVRFLL